MSLVHADFVEETTTTTGTGTLTLAGATTGNRTFLSTIGEGNTCIYAIRGSDNSFEVGEGTIASATLARTRLITSSTGSAIDLPAGEHTVYCTFSSEGGGLAHKAPIVDEDVYITVGTDKDYASLEEAFDYIQAHPLAVGVGTDPNGGGKLVSFYIDVDDGQYYSPTGRSYARLRGVTATVVIRYAETLHGAEIMHSVLFEQCSDIRTSGIYWRGSNRCIGSSLMEAYDGSSGRWKRLYMETHSYLRLNSDITIDYLYMYSGSTSYDTSVTITSSLRGGVYVSSGAIFVGYSVTLDGFATISIESAVLSVSSLTIGGVDGEADDSILLQASKGAQIRCQNAITFVDRTKNVYDCGLRVLAGSSVACDSFVPGTMDPACNIPAGVVQPDGSVFYDGTSTQYKQVILTQAAYEAIATPDPGTIYNIIDADCTP